MVQYYHIIVGCQNLSLFTSQTKVKDKVLTFSLGTYNNFEEIEKLFRERFFSESFTLAEDETIEQFSSRQRYINEVMIKIRNAHNDELIDCSNLSDNMGCCYFYVFVNDSEEAYLTQSQIKLLFPND